MASHAHDLPHDEHHRIGHVMPVPQLLAVFVALVALTFLTVWQGTQLELGRMELVVVLVIATLKAALVVAYFMHLRYDKPLNALAFLFSLLFVALFLGLTLMDAWTYQPDVAAKDYEASAQ